MAISSSKHVVEIPARAQRTSGANAKQASTKTAARIAPVVRTPDLCVIGAGSGGLSLAAAAATLGVSVVLIEKHKMGGDCLNAGCVPSKALIAVAKRAHDARTGAPFGVMAREPAIDFKRVRGFVHDVIGGITPNDSAARFAALGVEVIQATGRFIDAKTVEAGDVHIRARRYVIATGSSPALPDIPGLETVPYLTNETVFNLEQAIGHLVIIGGGAIGVELAQAYRRLGSRVTILEAKQALASGDPELTAVALRQLRNEGVVIREGVAVSNIGGRSGAIEISYSDGDGNETVLGTHLLLAVGRKPNIDGLGLQSAHIRTGTQGIEVNGGLVTSNRRVYAIGDVTGGAQFTHAANYHAGIVVRRALFRLPTKVRVEQIPRVTFTDPEIAQVGLTEAQAKARGHKIMLCRSAFCDNDRARTQFIHGGLIKVVCDRGGRILGAGIVGPQAGELIQVWSLALSQGLNIEDMARWVAPYPTLGEISKRAAMSAVAQRARRPGVRKLLSILRKFG